jgi:YYY domain-containing protein
VPGERARAATVEVTGTTRGLSRKRARDILVILLFLGAFSRLEKLNWDEHHHLHPDERFISMVEEKLQAPSSLGQYFDSARSPMNPYNRGNDSFVYGTVPMFISKAVSALIGKTGYDGTFLAGRALSALFDLLTVWLVYRIVRRFAGRRSALLGAGLLAFSPLAIQLSHFWTVDTFLTTFTTATLLGAARQAQGRSRFLLDVGTGAALGLAVACKVTGLALLLPVGVAILVGAFAASDPARRRWPAAVGSALARSLAVFAGAAVTARIALPYAFLGPSPLSFRLDPRWIVDLKRLTSQTTSVAGFPPNFQWAGRTIAFPLKNIVLWGMGPFFGLAALAAAVWFAVSVWKRRRLALLPLLLHVLFLIAYHGLTQAKSMRYFYPAYPALAVLAALFITDLAHRQESAFAPLFRRLVPAVMLAGAFVCALAFTSIYRHDQPRIAASRWMYEHVTPPRRFLNETWDDGLPLSLPGHDSGQYSGPQLNIIGADNTAKVEEIVKALEGTDWISITSNRAYGSLTRIPDVFPMSRAYYLGLFEGRLGFDWIADFTSYPSLGPIQFPDDNAEEAFTVYDHPRVLLFRKSKDFSADRVRKILLASMRTPPPYLGDWEKWPRSQRRVVAALVPPHRRDLARSEPVPVKGESRTGSLAAALLWYLAAAGVGAVAMPFTYRLFARLPDRGFGFARILGLAVSTYLLAAFVQRGLVQNGRRAALLGLGLLAAASLIAGWRRRQEIWRFARDNRRQVLWGEVAFAIGFLLFLWIRALNPEIYWGEKPMDFSILNILVRTRTFPASDPWFAGAPLSYYVFGQQMVAFLTLLTGLSTRYTFNLAFGLLGGAALQGAFSLARSWANSLRAGVAGMVLTAVLGNLSGLRELLVNKRHIDWDYFWATSRVIPNTINEYPLWSLTFADLHAHVLAMPLLLLFFACALQFVRTYGDSGARRRQRLLHAALLGFSAALVALTNAWDVPLVAGLLLLVALVSARSEGGISLPSVRRAVVGLAVTAGTALLAVAPFWVRTGGGMPGIGKNMETGRGIDVLLVFGLFFFLAFALGLDCINARLEGWGVGRLTRSALLFACAAVLLLLGVRWIDVLLAAGVVFFLFATVVARSPERRLTFGFLATAFFLVYFAQHYYIYDRMNTFFKLYFEAWLLFSVSIAVLVFGRREMPGAFQRWSLPPRAASILLAAMAVFTSATGLWGALGHHFTAYSGPSLDGLRYLEESRPGEYQAVAWMRRTIRGTPVVLEAQGPSYQDFSRISMLTGFPTVLGWDYHVKQRGNSDAEIEVRRKAVEQIYKSPTIDPVEGLLRRYHVGYVYSGWLERKTYPPEGLKKLDTAKGLLELVYQNREAKVYRVVGGETEDVMGVTRETLPAPAKAEPQGDEPEEPPSIAESAAPDRLPFSGMREPRGAAVDREGRVWVADFGNNRVRVFNPEGGFLGGWGGRGSGTFGLQQPSAVAIQGEDLYIADTWNGRLESFTLDGKPKTTVTALYGPRGIAVAPDGAVWTADTGNNRVVRYNHQLLEPRIVGKKGSEPGEFSGPVGIAVGPSGSVYVADPGNRRIQVLSSEGAFQSAIAFPGWPEGCEPQLLVDKDETLYVTDPVKNGVVHLDRRGSLLKTWITDDSGKAFSKPTGIAIDRERGILYVVNSGNNSVSICKLSERKTP